MTKLKQKHKNRSCDLHLLEYAALIGSNNTTTGSKIKKLIKRNHQRNIALYELSVDLNGIEYVVCPVLGIRTLNIKKQYVEGVLGLTWNDFRQKYPNIPLSCNNHSRNISTWFIWEETESQDISAAFNYIKETLCT